MTKEELKQHCEKQVKACEMWAENRGQEPSGKVYEEHKLILEILEENEDFQKYIDTVNHTNSQLIQLIEKHKMNRDTSDDCVSRKAVLDCLTATGLKKFDFILDAREKVNNLPPVTPTQTWIPLVWDEYPTVDIDGNDDYVYAVDYSVPMPNEDEWVLITDENHNVVSVQYDGYDFGDYDRENILAWQPLPKPYEE